MISFWATQANSFTIRNYCRNRGRTIADRFQVHIYDEIGEVVQFPGATQIFSDIDLISNSQRDIVRMIWDAHARKVPGVPRLNNARNVLLRFQLLNTLYERGINAFRGGTWRPRSEGNVATSATNLVHFEGRLIPETEATISPLSAAMAHGPIAYETLRGYWNEDRSNLFLFRLHDHLARLTASMKILRFSEVFTRESMSEWIRELVRTNHYTEDIHIRMSVYPLDRSGPGRSPERSGIVIGAHPRPDRPPEMAHCQVSSWVRHGGDHHPARVKAVGSRMFSRAALAQAEMDGYTDLIIQDERGRILEATTSNVFIVRQGVLATPRVTDQILEGITRDTLVVIARNLGIRCVERPVDRTELYDCREAFLCSTGLEILPIASVDRLTVGDGAAGPITDALRRQYRSIVRGAAPLHGNWLTAVY